MDVKFARLLNEAQLLVAGCGKTNPEYCRGIVELLGYVLPMEPEVGREFVADLLGLDLEEL